MALHHINGDRFDNRVENLELLCPNCHSQTDTFGGRNSRRLALARDVTEDGKESPDTKDARQGEGADPLAA
jgi:hypothetical protein